VTSRSSWPPAREATLLVEHDPELSGAPALRAAIAELVDAERADYLEKA
jgi:ATP-dependent DNA helicase RecG